MHTASWPLLLLPNSCSRCISWRQNQYGMPRSVEHLSCKSPKQLCLTGRHHATDTVASTNAALPAAARQTQLSGRQLKPYLRLMTKLPLLCIWEGVGSRTARFSVSTKNLSSVAGTLTGAPSSFQLGNSSVKAWGSRTLPDRMWAPAGSAVLGGARCLL